MEIITLGISMLSLFFSVFTYVITVRRNRKQATLDAYNCLQEQVFDRLNQYTPSEIREIAKNNRSSEYKTISGLTARIEHFCVGVNQGIYDFKTMYELAHGYFDAAFLRVRIDPLLEKKHQNTSYDYYSNIHSVWAKMDQQTKKQSKR